MLKSQRHILISNLARFGVCTIKTETTIRRQPPLSFFLFFYFSRKLILDTQSNPSKNKAIVLQMHPLMQFGHIWGLHDQTETTIREQPPFLSVKEKKRKEKRKQTTKRLLRRDWWSNVIWRSQSFFTHSGLLNAQDKLIFKERKNERKKEKTCFVPPFILPLHIFFPCQHLLCHLAIIDFSKSREKDGSLFGAQTLKWGLQGAVGVACPPVGQLGFCGERKVMRAASGHPFTCHGLIKGQLRLLGWQFCIIKLSSVRRLPATIKGLFVNKVGDPSGLQLWEVDCSVRVSNRIECSQIFGEKWHGRRRSPNKIQNHSPELHFLKVVVKLGGNPKFLEIIISGNRIHLDVDWRLCKGNQFVVPDCISQERNQSPGTQP